MKDVVFTLFAALTLAIGLQPVPTAAQDKPPNVKTTAAVKKWIPPRTPDGQPDLQGIWSNVTVTPLERPSQFAGKPFLTAEEAAAYQKQALKNSNKDRRDGSADDDLNRAYNEAWYESVKKTDQTIRTSLVIDPPDGRIPAWTPEVQKREDARTQEMKRRGPEPADSWEDRTLSERCITLGAPRLPRGYNSNFQIVQTPKYVVILHEMIHEARIIPLDGRPHIDKNIPQWLGDSRGRWEGNTLIVDTTNFNDKIVFNIVNCCRGAGANLHVIERFTRLDADTIDYQYTVDDPSTFTKPYTVALPWTKIDGPLFEYACHEGNYGMVNILSNARAAEAAARDAAKKK
ncbi:MAG: hypothetical protein LAP38_15710 [Acidobacteriia bacterium]|nr:hypothetical protein [Terriglobia bacterium]